MVLLLLSKAEGACERRRTHLLVRSPCACNTWGLGKVRRSSCDPGLPRGRQGPSPLCCHCCLPARRWEAEFLKPGLKLHQRWGCWPPKGGLTTRSDNHPVKVLSSPAAECLTILQPFLQLIPHSFRQLEPRGTWAGDPCCASIPTWSSSACVFTSPGAAPSDSRVRPPVCVCEIPVLHRQATPFAFFSFKATVRQTQIDCMRLVPGV